MQQSTYSRYVALERNPPLAQIDALCHALSLNIGELLTEADAQTAARFGMGGLK
jgi:hypothetical protein